MRTFLLLSLLLFSVLAQSQPLSVAYNKPVTLINTATDKLFFTLSKDGQQHFVELSGSGWGTVTISEGDESVLVFANDSTIKLRSVAMQSFDYGTTRQTYTHRYTFSEKDLSRIGNAKLVGIRKSSFGEWSSIAISAKGADAFKALSALLQPAPKVAASSTVFYLTNLGNLSEHNGDSVVFCAKVLSADVIGQTTLLQLQDGARTAQAVIPAAHRAVTAAPGRWYTGKEVCVAGVVQLVNNVPQLVLRSRQGLKVTSAITDADAAFFVGDNVTLTGIVASANYLASSATKPTLLNTGGVYPDQALTVMIAQSDRAAFGGQPEKDYLSRRIAVTGTVTLYKGKPQIVVSRKEQLQLLDAPTAPVATVPFAKTEVPKATVPSPSPIPVDAGPPTSIDAQPATRREKTSPGSDYSETLAVFPGGDTAQRAFLRTRLQCPASAGDETKTVTASFQVESDGSISGIRIEQSGGKAYDAEVIRVLQQMPKWRPRVRNGFGTLDKLYQTITFYCAKRRGA